MKKKAKGLIILAIVLVVAIAAVIILTNYNKNKEAKEEDAGTQLFWTESAVAELSYMLNGEKLCFLNETAGWVYTEEEALLLDGAVMDAMADMLTTIEADKLVEEGADLEKYGLDEPWNTVEFTLESGESHVLELGDENAAVSGIYAMLDNSGDVYILSDLYTSIFSSEVVSLASIENIPHFNSETSMAKYIALESAESKMEIEYHEEPPYKIYSTTTKWFVKDEEGYDLSNEDVVQTVISNISALYAQGVIAVYPEESELAGYGLDAPIKLGFGFETASEEGESTYSEYTLLIGDEFERDGQNYRYVMQQDGTQVVAMSADVLAEIVNISREDLLPVDICPLLRYQMKRMEVRFGGKEYKVTFESETVKNDDGSEGTQFTYFVDGVQIENGSFLDWYYILSGMVSEGIAEGELTGESVLQVEFHRNEGDGFDDMTMNFYKYNSDFYRVEFGGEDYMLANKRDVEAFMAGASELDPA